MLAISGMHVSLLIGSIYNLLIKLNLNQYRIKMDLSIKKVFIITISILVILNPFIIYNIGFIFSSIISGYLILFSDLISKKKNYFSKVFMTSFVAWIVSFPIVIYNFFEINFLSVIYNVFCVPFVSFIIFPMAFITMFFSKFSGIFVSFSL